MRKRKKLRKLLEEGISKETIRIALERNENDVKLVLPVYISGGTVVDDPSYFANIRWARPRGVVINGNTYPFRVDTKRIGKNGIAFSMLGRIGLYLPTEEQVKILSENYTKYKAIAQLLGVEYYTETVFEHPSNSEKELHCFNFEENKEFTQTEASFFTVKKM